LKTKDEMNFLLISYYLVTLKKTYPF
jgi:hypothetical protein